MDEFWKKDAVGYQIYIRSFADSNNDGIGDLRGIINKLDYITELGANFIWITPFYDSPMVDNGYDIRNYYLVDESYGTNEDLQELIKTAHEKGIKIVIDLVMNHTSDECEWFIKSKNRISPYKDFYYWMDGNIVNGTMVPPNNWQSCFSGTAWKYCEERNQYYLRLFAEKMPDINYESPTAMKEMQKVIEYYGKMGVDGFRVDAISHIGKDLSFKNAKDETKSYKLFSNLPRTHKYLQTFNQSFAKYNLVTMGELGGNPSKRDLLKYTTKQELDMVFSFEQQGVFTDVHTIDRKKLFQTLKTKNTLSEKLGWSVVFWNNHDYPRLMSRVKGERNHRNAYLCLSTLMYMLKGTPMIYNGEELGIDNYEFHTIDDFKDIDAKMEYENASNKFRKLKELRDRSRDNARTIMPWNTTKNTGFSRHKPWFHVIDDERVCVENELADEKSILNEYRKILNTRKQLAQEIRYGKYQFIYKKGLIGYIIKHGNNKYVVYANLSDDSVPLECSEVLYSNVKINNNLMKPYCVAVAKM